MRMGDFHCKTVEMYFGIAADAVEKQALIEATAEWGEAEKEEGGEDKGVEISLLFASRDNPENHHAHMRVQFLPEEDVQVRISFHDSKGEVEDEEARKPPHMEDAVKWLGQYIKRDELTMGMTLFYGFEEDFAPALPLPYPVLSKDKMLAGTMVTGLSIQFPSDSIFDHAIVQTIDKKFGVSINGHDEINLKDFDLYEELKKLEPTVMALTIKLEKDDEERSKKQD
jgi:hypothetical protein